MNDSQQRPVVLRGGMAISPRPGRSKRSLWRRRPPAVAARGPLDAFLAEHPELPFELPPGTRDPLAVTGLRYRLGVWRLSPSAVMTWLAAELGIDGRSDAVDGHVLRFPSGYFDDPDGAADRIGAALLKLAAWHGNAEIERWAARYTD